jgi:Domain of unknown function (DUF5671)
VSDPDGGEPSSPFTGRAAFAISQIYYYVAAAIGLGFLVGGTIAALIALRQWILPGSGDAFGTDPDSAREAARSFLGALAFAAPGGLVFAWHIREARRHERVPVSGTFWGWSLYFHLVAMIALPIALGGLVAGLHSLRDAALPTCFERHDPEPLPPVESPVPGISPGVEIPIGSVDSPLLDPDCYPPSDEALRTALDSGLVALVAGGTWWWHLRRGRRGATPPPPAA